MYTIEITVAVPQKDGNLSTLRSTYKGGSTIPQGHMHNYVHNSFIHNTQKLQATLMSPN